MDIRYKLFPYPVLSLFTDDYENSGFISEIKAIKDINNIKFYLNVLLDNTELADMIRNDQAEYVYHIECSQTSYREILKTSEIESIKIIPESKLKGRVNVCTFIIAKEKITKFKNNCFNSDYEGLSFSLEKGSILAIANQFNIDIIKDIEDISKVPSIFSILKRDIDEGLGMDIDIDGDKIKLWLNDEDFYNYKIASGLPTLQPILHSSIVLPSLIYTFETLRTSNLEDYESYRWFRVIEHILKKSDFEFNKDLLEDIPSYQLAQRLLSLPISRGLNSIVDTEMEDEDE